jgi:hypothetical protein
VVEDEDSYRMLLDDLLDEAFTKLANRVEKQTVTTFPEALGALNSLKSWHLLISDIGFKNREGKNEKLGMRLVKKAFLRNIPAIAISGAEEVTKADVNVMLTDYKAKAFIEKHEVEDNKFIDIVLGILSPRDNISKQFSAGEIERLSLIFENLDQDQVKETLSALEALDKDKITVADMKTMIETAGQQIQNLNKSKYFQERKQLYRKANKVSEILADPSLETRHKIKLTLPIIPFILTYSGEMEFEGGVKLRTLWKRILSRA